MLVNKMVNLNFIGQKQKVRLENRISPKLPLTNISELNC